MYVCTFIFGYLYVYTCVHACFSVCITRNWYIVVGLRMLIHAWYRIQTLLKILLSSRCACIYVSVCLCVWVRVCVH